MIGRSRGSAGLVLAMAAMAAMPSPALAGSLPMEIKAYPADDFGYPRIDWKNRQPGEMRETERNPNRKKMQKQSRRKNR